MLLIMVKVALFILSIQMHHLLKALLYPTPSPIYIGNNTHLFQSNTHLQTIPLQSPPPFSQEHIANNKNNRVKIDHIPNKCRFKIAMKPLQVYWALGVYSQIDKIVCKTFSLVDIVRKWWLQSHLPIDRSNIQFYVLPHVPRLYVTKFNLSKSLFHSY